MTADAPLEIRHAMYVGWVLGIAIRNGLDVEAVLDDAGNYTDRLEVKLRQPKARSFSSSVAVVLVVPPPPDDWILT